MGADAGDADADALGLALELAPCAKPNGDRQNIASNIAKNTSSGWRARNPMVHPPSQSGISAENCMAERSLSHEVFEFWPVLLGIPARRELVLNVFDLDCTSLNRCG